MEQQIFTNESILSWLQYFAKNTAIDLEKVKMLDITRKNKNLIPTVESHRAVLVFTEAGIADIFYRMWNAGLGDCEVWYNEGSEPAGEIKHDKVSNMINRGINASAGMLIVNEHACNTYKIGMDNHNFKRGSIHYVGSEIRSVILNKMHVGHQDDICVISGPCDYGREYRSFRSAQHSGYRSCGRGDHEGLSGSVTGIYGGISQHGAGNRISDKIKSKDQYRDLYP